MKIKRLKPKIKYFLIFFVLPVLILVPAGRVCASSSILYVSPSSGSFLVGSTFTVSIYLNTNENKINAVWLDIKFPPELLQVTSPTAGKSFITEWTAPPSYSNEKGIISFRGGIPGGISTSAGLISSITFRAAAFGVANIKISEDSKILLNDGKGTNILSNIINGEYHILMPSPEGPLVVSETHPNPEKWYSDSSPSFSWEKEDGVGDYSWSFSQNPQEAPDGISDGNDNFTSYSNIKDGIWYFHIRQQKNGIWGKTSHTQVKIDTSPPKDFLPRIESSFGLAGYQMIYFETSDDFSGVDHYQVNLIDLSGQESLNSFFTEEISPYKIPFKESGEYKVIIRAVDKAGNFKEANTQIKTVNSFLVITGGGVRAKNLFFPLWILYLIIGIIILICSYLVYLFLRWLKRRTENPQVNLYKEINEAEKEIDDVKAAEEKLKQMRINEEKASDAYQKLKERLREETDKNQHEG
jgi:hypothetical protein